ncbi:hypothetical protein PpBr36_00092 [Pyricularia pennisetigena]|uniref:hypothetical protein n=1 Tax=Pyricularia pennisetigena TaxID=1578925 RepID=UPI0011540A08|nr:hypothetical protein PpBr36_00092 [Pyricularia pennisetigena]TLS27988.1 hypothetical protein PpBr36_00092 [Pyricularia pennisetigena]
MVDPDWGLFAGAPRPLPGPWPRCPTTLLLRDPTELRFAPPTPALPGLFRDWNDPLFRCRECISMAAAPRSSPRLLASSAARRCFSAASAICSFSSSSASFSNFFLRRYRMRSQSARSVMRAEPKTDATTAMAAFMLCWGASVAAVWLQAG